MFALDEISYLFWLDDLRSAIFENIDRDSRRQNTQCTFPREDSRKKQIYLNENASFILSNRYLFVINCSLWSYISIGKRYDIVWLAEATIETVTLKELSFILIIDVNKLSCHKW